MTLVVGRRRAEVMRRGGRKVIKRRRVSLLSTSVVVSKPVTTMQEQLLDKKELGVLILPSYNLGGSTLTASLSSSPDSSSSLPRPPWLTAG
jgi:hypothetical protein